MRHATTFVAILSFTPLTDATAQVRQPPIERGARVRVTMPPHCPAIYTSCTGLRDQQNVGTLLAWNADSLVMESNGDTLVVPLDSVITLAVKPPQAMVKGAAAGFGLGATIGGIVGALAGLDVETSVEQQHFDCDIFYGGCRTRTVNKERTALSGGNVVMGALIGGGLGIFMGATLGANRWVAVSPGRLGLNVRPRRGGTLGLGASVRF